MAQEITGSLPLTVNSFNEGSTIIHIDHDTKQIHEFTDYLFVGFSEKGDLVSNNCTLEDFARGVLRLFDRLEELQVQNVEEKAKLKEARKSRLKVITGKDLLLP